MEVHIVISRHMGTPHPVGVPTADWLVGTLMVCASIFVVKPAYRKSYPSMHTENGQVISSATKWAHREPRPIHTPKHQQTETGKTPTTAQGAWGEGEDTPKVRAH